MNGNRKKVLIIDSEEACGLLKVIIKNGLPSVKVETVTNAVVGLRKVVAEVYDVIFISVELPHFGGFVVAEAIRKIKSCANTKIVAITSSAHIPHSEFLKNGFDQVIIRPFKRGVIIEAIGEIN